jgi:hypothetical protein
MGNGEEEHSDAAYCKLRREEERLTAREAVVVDEDAGCVLLDAVVVDAVLSHKVLLRTKPNMHHIISIFYGACWVWCSTKVSSTKLGKRVGGLREKILWRIYCNMRHRI